MFVALISESSEFIARQEQLAIARYRRFNRCNMLVNEHGHVGCQNRAPGGENAHHGISPFFLYVVVGRRGGWRGSKQQVDGGSTDAGSWSDVSDTVDSASSWSAVVVDSSDDEQVVASSGSGANINV